jgi:SAM-dependent methyltransferase
MAGGSMRDFWDRRAEEDPFYFVDNRLEYRAANREAFWAGGEQIVETILTELGVSIPPDATVLDIGCGIGRTTRALARRARHVIALDVSERMLELAREHNCDLVDVEWIRGDGRSLEAVDSASIDACFSHVTFQHVPDPEVTLNYVSEMGRVLRAGGWSAFQVSDDPDVHRPPGLRVRARGRLRSLLGRGPAGQSHRAWLGAPVDLARLREVARAAGAPVERVTGEGTQMCLVLLRK